MSFFEWTLKTCFIVHISILTINFLVLYVGDFLGLLFGVITNRKKDVCSEPGLVVQLVESLIADHGVMSLIPAWPHTFVEFDHEIFSTA